MIVRSGASMNANPGLPPAFAQLLPGDPAPWFRQRSTSSPLYTFDTAAGRYIVLCFFGSAGDAQGQEAVSAVLANRRHFDDARACFFGVSIDPADEAQDRVRASMPGLRYFWDFDMAVSRLYGAVPKDAQPGATVPTKRFWMVLDPTLRILQVFPLARGTQPCSPTSTHCPRPPTLPGSRSTLPCSSCPTCSSPSSAST